MRGLLAGFILLASMGSVVAREVAIIADDQHYNDMLQLIDAALKGQGVAILPQANRVLDILQKASTVVDKNLPPPSSKSEPSPNKGTEHKD